MKALITALKTLPGWAGLVAAALLCLVIWFFAPVFLKVEAWWVILPLALIPLAVWAIVLVSLSRRKRLRDETLVSGATELNANAQLERAADKAASQQEAEVAAKLAEALGALKGAAGGQGEYLYERPWYIMIGPPNAGKTTAIAHSGLKFPLIDKSVSGVGGTRNCAWWIAEQAIIIDTAGRYTTQDSDSRADKAGWERFLELLKRERALQPLNGVIVAFGIDQLCSADLSTRQQHAQAVRSRVRELETKLGQRLPVYLLVSKADLIAGFNEYFADLDSEGRRQVWGISFAPQPGPEGSVSLFEPEFDGLLRRLQDRQLDRLQAERGAEQRAAIAGFPVQFASVREPLSKFIQAAFGGSKLDPAPFLRGVYFTSGTQEGTPIDRLAGALSRAFGLTTRPMSAMMGPKGRSFFLGRLLLDVVFNEARLAARDSGQKRRQKLLRSGAAVLAGVALLCGAGWGWYASSRESARGERVSAMADRVEELAKAVPKTVALHSLPGADLAKVLPYLNQARALAEAAEGSSGALGIGQQAKLESAAGLAYRRAMERTFLPQLLARLEAQIRTQMQQPAYLYLATRIYLMLGRQGPLDAALIREWMQADWAEFFPGQVNAAARGQLMLHLNTLLEQDFVSYAVDGVLVDGARRAFSRLPTEERIYNRLRGSAGKLPPWRLLEHIPPSGQRLFVLASGQPMAEAVVSSLFTVEGFHRGFLPSLPLAIKEAQEESWVLGPEGSSQIGDPVQLESAVVRRYAQAYAAEWQKLFDSVNLAPLGGPTQSAEALNLLAAPNSPLKDLLKEWARQLNPALPPPAATAPASAAIAASAAVALKDAAKAATPPLASRVAEALGVASGSGAPPPPVVLTAALDVHFRPLREAAGAPLDSLFAALNELYVQVARIASSAPGGASLSLGAGLDPGQRLQAEAQRMPQPLSRWMMSLVQGSAGVRAGGARAAVAAAAGQQLAPFCRNLETRFPFDRRPQAPDMPLDDFGNLFRPAGVLDSFFVQNLKDVVDTTNPRAWKPVSVAGMPTMVSSSDVMQFQRAAAIRNAFFPAAVLGQGSGGLQFELVPLGGTGGVFSTDGVNTVLPTGSSPGRPLVLQWPSRGLISLGFDGEPAGAAWTYEGPWAPLRLVARMRAQATAIPNHLRLTAQQGGKTLEFELRARSIVHPFNMQELAEFRCPRLTP